ncbi:hypothetical protein HGA34_04595 [Candidatus Falkowbacteria bacterium]|nr:hypothetical protein [Candidatus Falkowbacteria bacterium]
MNKRLIFPVCSCMAFVGLGGFVMFQGAKHVLFFKLLEQAFTAIFNFAISAFAHG